jgi:hypothetical protein
VEKIELGEKEESVVMKAKEEHCETEADEDAYSLPVEDEQYAAAKQEENDFMSSFDWLDDGEGAAVAITVMENLAVERQPSIADDIWTACRIGDVDFVTDAIANEPGSINQILDGRAPLYLACHGGHAKIVKALLDAGAKDTDGTAFLSALNDSCKKLLRNYKKKQVIGLEQEVPATVAPEPEDKNDYETTDFYHVWIGVDGYEVVLETVDKVEESAPIVKRLARITKLASLIQRNGDVAAAISQNKGTEFTEGPVEGDSIQPPSRPSTTKNARLHTLRHLLRREGAVQESSVKQKVKQQADQDSEFLHTVQVFSQKEGIADLVASPDDSDGAPIVQTRQVAVHFNEDANTVIYAKSDVWDSSVDDDDTVGSEASYELDDLTVDSCTDTDSMDTFSDTSLEAFGTFLIEATENTDGDDLPTSLTKLAQDSGKAMQKFSEGFSSSDHWDRMIGIQDLKDVGAEISELLRSK